MAQTAAQLLLERLGGLKSKPRTVTLTPELVVRSSCGGDVEYRILQDASEPLSREIGNGTLVI